MAVKTQKQKKVVKEQGEKKSSPAPIKKGKPKFTLSWVKMGKVNAAFYYKKREVTIKLQDRVVIIPSNLSKNELVNYYKMLKEIGCKDVSIIDSKPVKKEKKIYEVEFAHPDNAVNEPVQGNFSLIIADKEKQFTLSDSGTVITSEKEVIDALRKAGFVEVGKKEVKED
jgi:hypothetical protein